MAEPIVRTFVIDTSKAEQNLQSLNVASAATSATLDALYNELIKLDEALGQTDPNSESFAKLSTEINKVEAAITNIETGKLSTVANDIQDIGNATQGIDTSNLQQIETSIEGVAPAATETAKALDDITESAQKVDGSKLDNLPPALDNAEASSKSLKAQLRELQAQLANTDPQTEKYRELSQAAGELKDRIQDAAQTVGTQAGGAFERVSGSLGLVTSRITSLDFEGAAEGAKLLAQNISQVKPGDIANGIKGIGSAFASVGKALLTNPIFLIGAAIAAAVVYADELLSLVDGVSSAEAERLELQKQSAAQSKEQLDAISQQENILKLAGKTEREILDIKIAAGKQALLDQRAVIETLKLQKQQQIEAAERNRDILKGLLNFVSLPLTALLAGVDTLTERLNAVGVISDETFAKFGNLRDKFTTSVAELVFDPAEVAAEGDAAIKEAEKTLQSLENQQAGFQLSLNQINQKAADERQKQRDEELAADIKLAQQILEIRRKTAEESAKITEQIRKDAAKPIDSPKSEIKNFDDEIKAQRDAEEQRISFMAEGIDKEIALVDLKYARMRDAAQGNATQIAAIVKANTDEVAAIEQAAAEKRKQQEFAVQDAKLASASEALGAINGLVAAFAKKDEKSARRAFKAQKAISIAQATVETYKGANAIFASAAANPATVLFPAQPFIAAGAAIAAGLANVATIAKQEFQGGTQPGGTETPPPSIGGGGGGESQPAQFNPLAAQFIQDRPEQLTPRAFVLAGDVASQQEVRQKVEDLARLG